MKLLQLTTLALSIFLLSACGSVSPIPGDTFYRFNDVSIASAHDKAWTGGVVAIDRVRASGIYKDRAIAILKEDGVSLIQSKYHYWNDSPEVLIQQRIFEHAIKAAVAPTVSLKVDTQTDYVIGGRLSRFERLENYSGGSGVAIELTLNLRRADDSGEIIFEQQQRFVEASDSAEVRDAVLTLSAGLDKLIAEFFSAASRVVVPK